MTADNADVQRQLYGAPLRDLVGHVMEAFGLTQARLADLLGLSAPMLSQLISATRVKIGNPAVVHRLQSLIDLADGAATLSPEEVRRQLAAIREEHADLTSTTLRRQGGDPVLARLRELGTPEELVTAANALSPHSALADLMRRAAGERARG